LQAPYDICSIMHYGPVIFSKNGEPTITVKDEYKSSRCTETDIRKLYTLYRFNGYPQTGGNSSRCEDIWTAKECKDYAAEGLCTADFMEEEMKQNCPKTCNLCPESNTINKEKVTTISKEKILKEYENKHCSGWACQGSCTDEVYEASLNLSAQYTH
jgi:hypothetical protein